MQVWVKNYLQEDLFQKELFGRQLHLIDEKNHQLVIDTHLSSINAGADVILTNTFTTRRVRMEQNQVGDLFNFANLKACELALEAKELSKKNIINCRKSSCSKRYICKSIKEIKI